MVTDEGILLRSHSYSESSRILRFLTPSHGLLSVMAKGARRRSSRGESAPNTFDQVTLTFYHRADRDLHTLRDLDVTRGRRGLGREVMRFAGASLLAELLLAHTLQEANPRLYRKVSETLDGLEGAPTAQLPGRVLAGAWSVLGEAGFPPVLDRCARCDAELPDGVDLLRFNAAQGGLLCARCGSEAPGARLGPTARSDLRHMARGEAPEGLRGAPGHVGLLENFALHHLSPRRAFHSTGLLRTVLEAAENRDSSVPGSS